MQAINWVYCEDQLPDYGNSVLFCEATDLRR